jgi:glutamine amidotransferase
VQEIGKPFLGICVGMQLMGTLGLEHGKHAGLGWLNGTVRALEPSDETLKVPHMGWNELELNNACHPVLDGLGDRPHVYFVHSYYFSCDSPVDVLATVDYGGPITAVVGRDNMVGTQFHPEKSQHAGLKLISNFLKWKP